MSNPAGSSPGTTSLRQKTTRGAMWIAAQAGATRVITVVQQLALAWLLSKADFGLIALTYTVSSFVAMMSNPGIDLVLVQRTRQYRHWATPAFWLGMTTSVLAMVFTIFVAAPVASKLYDQPKIIGLIVVLGFALPLQALQIVPKAQLQIQMRFRSIVLLGILNSALTAILTIGAAALGFGAYSFVLPVPIAAAIMALATWRAAGTRVRFAPDFHRWKHLFGNSAVVGVVKVLYLVINQADYVVLGLIGLPDAQIGAYSFAFNVAIQPSRLISSNIPVVLFPGLSHLVLDPEKQARAALRAMRLLMLIVVPTCGLQIVLAEPMFRLLFPPRWMDAVLPCQILTVALMINSGTWPAYSLLMARKEYVRQLWIVTVSALLFVAIMVVATWIAASILSVAIGVAIFHFVYNPFIHWCAVHGYVPRGSFLRETGPPILAGLGGAIACLGLQQFLPATTWGDVTSIVAGGALFTAVYALLVYLLVPATVHDFWQQVSPFWQRIWPKKAQVAAS